MSHAMPSRSRVAAERLNPARYTLHGREIEAVQLTEGNETEVFEWAPGKWRWESDGRQSHVVGMTVWADHDGGGPKTVAYFGEWITRDIGTGAFRAVAPREMGKAVPVSAPKPESAAAPSAAPQESAPPAAGTPHTSQPHPAQAHPTDA